MLSKALLLEWQTPLPMACNHVYRLFPDHLRLLPSFRLPKEVMGKLTVYQQQLEGQPMCLRENRREGFQTAIKNNKQALVKYSSPIHRMSV